MKTNKLRQKLFEDRAHQYIDEEQSFQGIQMANFKTINKNPDYVKLEDQKNYANIKQQKNLYSNIKHTDNFKKVFTDQPVVPNASYNFQPNKIVMNGITYVHKDAIKGIIKTQTKTKKPQMQVCCGKCYSMQMVPANTNAFICFNCSLTQRCIPQYGIFICGHCEKQVWYPYATSQYIKCTKCGTINKVPQEQFNTKNLNHFNQNPYLQKYQSQISFQQLASRNDEMPQKYFSQNYPEL